MLTKVIEQAKIDHFTKWFERADKIVIVSHVSPDGDAIGSSLGLYHFFDSQEKTVNVIVPNAFPDFLRWMPGSKDILLYDRYKEFADKLIAEADVICCLDFNALKRIDDMADAIAASPARKIMIDHHLYPEEFCKITMSYPKISSTSELIFRLICRMGYFSDISKEGAECIYTGMMTDTGGFTYNSNNREIYFIISELLSKGIDKDDIYRKVYNTYSESRLRLMGYVLSNMTVYSDYNAALITLTKAEQSKFNYIKGDSEGFVNIPLTIKNVCFSCFLREDTEKPMIKISLRSVGSFPCNQLAAEFFHGGGHLNASGGEFFGTMEEAKAVFEKALFSAYNETKGNLQMFESPLDFNWHYRISSYYGYRIHPISGLNAMHNGIDISAAEGTSIEAGLTGTVKVSGYDSGYGNYVVLTDEDGYEITYAHLSSRSVSAGEQIEKGTEIGKVGSTGNSTGPHLHLELSHNGEHLNPVFYFETGDSMPNGNVEYSSEAAKRLVEYALQFQGVPYVWGGYSPAGFDCSGFVSYCLTNSGVLNTGHMDCNGLLGMMTVIPESEMQPGDIIFFQGTYATEGASHVGIYIGNGQMVHSGNPNKISDIYNPYYQQHWMCVARW